MKMNKELLTLPMSFEVPSTTLSPTTQYWTPHESPVNTLHPQDPSRPNIPLACDFGHQIHVNTHSPHTISRSLGSRFAYIPIGPHCDENDALNRLADEDTYLLLEQEDTIMHSVRMVFIDDRDEQQASTPLGPQDQPSSLDEFTAGLISDGLGGSMPHPRTKKGDTPQKGHSVLQCHTSPLEQRFEHKFEAGLFQEEGLGGSVARAQLAGDNDNVTPIKGHRSTPLSTPLLEDDISETSSIRSDTLSQCHGSGFVINEGPLAPDASFEIENCSFHDSSDESFFDASFHGAIPGLDLFGGVESDMEIVDEDDESEHGGFGAMSNNQQERGSELKLHMMEGEGPRPDALLVAPGHIILPSNKPQRRRLLPFPVVDDRSISQPSSPQHQLKLIHINEQSSVQWAAGSPLGLALLTSLPESTCPAISTQTCFHQRKAPYMDNGTAETEVEVASGFMPTRPHLLNVKSSSLDDCTYVPRHISSSDSNQALQGRPRSHSAPAVIIATTSVNKPSDSRSNASLQNTCGPAMKALAYLSDSGPTSIRPDAFSEDGKELKLVRQHSSNRVSQAPSVNLTPIMEVDTPPLTDDNESEGSYTVLTKMSAVNNTISVPVPKLRSPHTFWTPEADELTKELQKNAVKAGVSLPLLEMLSKAPALFFFSSHEQLHQHQWTGSIHSGIIDARTWWRTKENKTLPTARPTPESLDLLPSFLGISTQLPEPIPRTKPQPSVSSGQFRIPTFISSRQPKTTTPSSSVFRPSPVLPQGAGISPIHPSNDFHFIHPQAAPWKVPGGPARGMGLAPAGIQIQHSTQPPPTIMTPAADINHTVRQFSQSTCFNPVVGYGIAPKPGMPGRSLNRVYLGPQGNRV